MVYKNKELLMQACNFVWHESTYYSNKYIAKTLYKYLINCGDENWYAHYRMYATYYADLEIESVYRKLIHSLNQFNKFKV